MKFFFRVFFCMVVAVMAMTFTGCKSVKLEDAEAAYSRGEYFDAQKIYKKV